MEFTIFIFKIINICVLLMFTISHGKINIPKRETDFDYIDNA